MHSSAMDNGRRFVEKYLAGRMDIRVLDVGSFDVNGNLKSLFTKSGWEYEGLDYGGVPDENVTSFIRPDGVFPFDDESFDVIVSSSCFEHDAAFWRTFSEMIRVSREGALIYLNVPSEGPYHPYPVDCWRFQADAFKALSSAFPQAELLESYITPAGQWRDNVGIFRITHFDSLHEDGYSGGFYDSIYEGSLRSAEIILPLLYKWIQPESVVDAGCGSGAWLSVIRSMGTEKVLGFDGSWAEESYTLDADTFFPADLTLPLPVDGPFDLAVSLEVAEHLPAERAVNYIADLVRLSDVVLFSAAVPFQGGVNHLNEQWPEYWASLFEKHGYRALDLIRPEVWDNHKVEWWYRQNILVFCRESVMPEFFPGVEPAETSKLRRVVKQGQPGQGAYRGTVNRVGSQQDQNIEMGPGSGNRDSNYCRMEAEARISCLMQKLLKEKMNHEKNLQTQRRRFDETADRLRQRIQDEEKRNRHLVSSSSWRMTSPVRWLKDALLTLSSR